MHIRKAKYRWSEKPNQGRIFHYITLVSFCLCSQLAPGLSKGAERRVVDQTAIDAAAAADTVQLPAAGLGRFYFIRSVILFCVA